MSNTLFILILLLFVIVYKSLSLTMGAARTCLHEEEGQVFYDLLDECGLYYVCKRSSSNSFHLELHTCPDGRAFNVSELKCDQSLFCNETGPQPSERLCPSCVTQCPQGTGRYQINSSCARFLECDPVHGQPKHLMCGHRQYYDRDTGQCVHGKCNYNLTNFDRNICESGEGSYPDFSSCKFYWYCEDSGAAPEERICGHRQYFDRNSEECETGACPYFVHEVEPVEWSYLDPNVGWTSFHRMPHRWNKHGKVDNSNQQQNNKNESLTNLTLSHST